MDDMIEDLYNGLNGDKTTKAQVFETIIETKHETGQYDTVQSLYRDIKGWCYNYISSKLEKDYGYDIYEHSKIIEKIDDKRLTPRQKLSLVNYVKYVLARYNDDGAWLDDKTTKYKLAQLKRDNWLKFLLALSASSIWNCLFSVIMFFVVELLILLPAPVDWMVCFDLQMIDYSTHPWLNYLSNVLALKIDWVDGPKLQCLNWKGVVLCGVWTIVYIAFVVNILFNNIFSKISGYGE